VNGDWCSVNIDPDGHVGLEMQTDAIRLQYGSVDFPDAAVNEVIFELEDCVSGVTHSVRQVDGVWRGYGDGRGERTTARVVQSTGRETTVLLEWGEGVIREEVSLFPGEPVIRFHYLDYGVNVVDILGPGGAQRGVYVAHGADEWQAQRADNTNASFRNEENEHNRLTADLFPTYPNPLYRRAWGPSALEYRGWFIIGLYDEGTGAGVGRLMPFDTVDVLKLLKGRGFEFFPCFGREHCPYTGYLYLTSGGADALLDRGRGLVDRINANSDALGVHHGTT